MTKKELAQRRYGLGVGVLCGIFIGVAIKAKMEESQSRYDRLSRDLYELRRKVDPDYKAPGMGEPIPVRVVSE